MRKYIALVLTTVWIFGCVGCSGENGQISEFSYTEDSEIYAEGKPGIKTFGFVNASEVEINSENVVEQAKKECTVKYNKIQIYSDSSTGMWKVEFSDENALGGDQTVYMTENGITTLIVYGE